MLLLLYELDVCIMTVFMFQENHGIEFNDQEPQQEGRRVHQGRWNMDFLRTLSAKQTRRSATPGQPYFKHFRINILLCATPE